MAGRNVDTDALQQAVKTLGTYIADVFDKKYSTLTGCTPYSNAIKLQFCTRTFTLMVPDGVR